MKLALIVTQSSDLLHLLELDSDFLFELRVDQDLSLLDSLEELPPSVQIILTLRSAVEGGGFTGDRDDLLSEMIAQEPTYIDLEIQRDLSSLEKITHSIPVLSLHDYSGTASETAAMFLDTYADLTGRDDLVIKFVGKPEDSYDMINAISLLEANFPRHVILGIGHQGILSRTLASDFKQEFVFGSTQNKGDIPHYSAIQEALQPGSLLTGLLGVSLDHSLSPNIHEIFRKAQHRAGYYHLFEVLDENNIQEFLELLNKTSVHGINVTYPYKQIVTKWCELDVSAQRTGVANTLVFGDPIKAYNTDLSGFAKWYDSIDFSESIQSAMILGAGGAAKAVALALLDRGIDITIYNRSESRLLSMPNEIRHNAKLRTLSEVETDYCADLYINATTVGYGEKSPTDILDIPPGSKLVIDLNYNKRPTVLVEEANDRGIPAFDGKGMLFHQAADAYEIWTNHTLDRDHLYDEFVRVMYD